MLVSLSEMKAYLGISGPPQDAFLNEQITYISEVVEAYCARKFSLEDYVQTFYYTDFMKYPTSVLLTQYPVTKVDSVFEDANEITNFRIHKPTGQLTSEDQFFVSGEELVITYTAGYAVIPEIVKQVVYGVVAQRYNKKVSGVSLDFGSDVQSVSIPGVINIQFDYSLDFNQRKNAYGSVLGSYSNMLDTYRSERIIVGSGKLEYVEVAP